MPLDHTWRVQKEQLSLFSMQNMAECTFELRKDYEHLFQKDKKKKKKKTKPYKTT
jgi:hypothetical protein